MIDLVLVTHAHFDHLDRRTLRAVAANQPIAVPFGVGNLVQDLGFERVHELDYWGTLTLRRALRHADPVPSLGRAACSTTQQRGFGGFVLSTAGGALGVPLRRHGVFRRVRGDRAALPGGDRAAAHRRLRHAQPARRPHEPGGGGDGVPGIAGARTLVPMHYGTFRLSYEPLEEPPQRLLTRAREAGVEGRVRLMEEGQPGVF